MRKHILNTSNILGIVQIYILTSLKVNEKTIIWCCYDDCRLIVIKHGKMRTCIHFLRVSVFRNFTLRFIVVLNNLCLGKKEQNFFALIIKYELPTCIRKIKFARNLLLPTLSFRCGVLINLKVGWSYFSSRKIFSEENSHPLLTFTSCYEENMSFTIILNSTFLKNIEFINCLEVSQVANVHNCFLGDRVLIVIS